jgi:predicted YcjX-like family ATPase
VPSLNLAVLNRRYKVIKELILKTFYIKSFDRTISNKLLADIQGTQATMFVLFEKGQKQIKTDIG